MTNHYSGDPYWTTAKFQSKCSKCGRVIPKGNQIFYYPKGKKVFCADACGTDAYQDFLAHAEDEYAYNH